MTAFIIICLVFLGMIVMADLIGTFAGDEEISGICILHLIPEILAIVALSIAL